MNRAAIILCGGQSTRMGRDKAQLLYGHETMLTRLIRIVTGVAPAAQTYVVAAEGQQLPVLPERIQIVRDQRPNRGPLEGMAAGFQALEKNVDAVFVTSCDVPLLVPELISRLYSRLAQFDAIVPRDGERVYPLTSVYRLTVLDSIQQLLSRDHLRVKSLFDLVNAGYLDVDEFRDIDPELGSFENLNHPEQYQRIIGRLSID